MELFPILPSGSGDYNFVERLDTQFFPNEHDIVSCTISDITIRQNPAYGATYSRGDDGKVNHAAPINIFLHTEDPVNVIHLQLVPTLVNTSSSLPQSGQQSSQLPTVDQTVYVTPLNGESNTKQKDLPFYGLPAQKISQRESEDGLEVRALSGSDQCLLLTLARQEGTHSKVLDGVYRYTWDTNLSDSRHS